MNSFTKLQKSFIVSSAIATTALVLSSTEAESKSETVRNSQSQSEKKLVQISPLKFQKSDLKLSKGNVISRHLTLLKSLEYDKDTMIQEIEPAWAKDTLLSKGDRGSKVKTVQQYLHETGYYLADIDGIFGTKTKSSVLHYQERHGLNIDGIIGEETISHLIGTKILIKNELQSNVALPPVFNTAVHLSSNNAPPYINKSNNQGQSVNYLQYGDQNEEVTSLQKQLIKTGYYQGPADGIYGTYTQQAVRTLQKNHSLQLDGLAGVEVHSFLENQNLSDIARQQKQNNSSSNSVNTSPSDKPESSTNESAQDTSEDQSHSSASTNETSTSTTESNEETTSNSNETESEPKTEPKTETKTDTATVSSSSLVQSAKNLLGTPYSWGGTSPSGFDCSGFLQYVFNQTGVSLPRTVADMWNATSSVSSPSTGDIVFFETYKPGPSHAGIYLGGGQFIHAGSSSGVTISEVHSSYWGGKYIGARSVN